MAKYFGPTYPYHLKQERFSVFNKLTKCNLGCGTTNSSRVEILLSNFFYVNANPILLFQFRRSTLNAAIPLMK